MNKSNAPPPKPVSPLKQVFNFLGSLELTVTLLSLAIVLIFCGTLAQIDQGIWTVVKTYFHSWFVWIDFQLFFPRDRAVPGAVPFPGGWTLGGLTLINLLVAHYQRFNFSKQKMGLLIIHSGLILLLVGEGLTGILAKESNMTIDEGSSANFSEDTRHPELAFVDESDSKTDLMTVIPERMLRQGDKLIQNPQLPVDVKIESYFTNSVMERNPSGPGFNAKEAPVVAGTQGGESGIDMPSAQVVLYKKNSPEMIGRYTTSTWLKASTEIKVDGKPYQMSLRFERRYKPYSLFLKDFRFDRYPGTEIPRNFESTVRLIDPEMNVDREVRIWMNNPLRYRGDTYYQASYKPDETGTVLQVVKNPSWLIPYISCVLVSLGLILQFGMSLSRSLKRRQKRMSV